MRDAKKLNTIQTQTIPEVRANKTNLIGYNKIEHTDIVGLHFSNAESFVKRTKQSHPNQNFF